MAAPLPLYLDIVSGRFITSPTNSQAIDTLVFYQGDVRTIQVRLLQPDPTGGPSAYTRVDISSVSLKFEVADTLNGTIPLVTQFTWTKVGTGGTDPYFTAEVAFNTAPVTTFLTGVTEKTAYLELEATEGTSVQTFFHGGVTLRTEIISSATSAVPAGQTALSLETAVATFVPFLAANGATITLPSSDGVYAVVIGCNTDGTIKMDVVTL